MLVAFDPPRKREKCRFYRVFYSVCGVFVVAVVVFHSLLQSRVGDFSSTLEIALEMASPPSHLADGKRWAFLLFPIAPQQPPFGSKKK